MRGICGNNLYARMSSFDSFNGRVDGFFTAIFEGGTEAHYYDSIFVRQVSQSRIYISFYTDLGCHQQRRGSVLNFVVQLICSVGSSGKAQQCSAGHRCSSKFFQAFHV